LLDLAYLFVHPQRRHVYGIDPEKRIFTLGTRFWGAAPVGVLLLTLTVLVVVL
jgi:hypothetical protein